MLDLAGMTPADLAALRSAVQSLEHPGLAARFTNMVGKPIELIGYALPASASQAITTATSKALELALQRSIAEIARREGEDLSDPEAALSSVQVFALGGRPGSADAMMTVETGSSMGSVAKPKAPPAAPDTVARAL